jgi:hypothetical protein
MWGTEGTKRRGTKRNHQPTLNRGTKRTKRFFAVHRLSAEATQEGWLCSGYPVSSGWAAPGRHLGSLLLGQRRPAGDVGADLIQSCSTLLK